MVSYLKKKKMTHILSNVFGINVKLKDVSYRFYRGTEWVYYYCDGFVYKVCAGNGGSFLSVEKTCYDENDEPRCLRYDVLNGFGKYIYKLDSL